jgi:hypothetical protein
MKSNQAGLQPRRFISPNSFYRKPALVVFLWFWVGLGLLGQTLWAKEAAPDSSWFVDLSRFSTSAHSTLTCEACHGTMKEAGKIHPELKDPRFLRQEASRLYDYGRCRSCHRAGYDRYQTGAHAQALQKEKELLSQGKSLEDQKTPAPTCGQCHSSHYEKAHRTRLEIGRAMTEACGSCHPAQKVTYLENNHGKKAVHLGQINSAYCSDCHGAHQCVSLKDKKAALTACRRCHPQAGERLAEFVIHPSTKDLTEKDREKKARVVLIQTVALVMLVLVAALVAFFYGHGFLWILREIHEKLKRRK